MLTRRMITRGARRQNKARREFLREPCDGLIVFGNACNNVANARKFFVRLATLLQTPKSFSGHLQRSCKGPFSHFGVCRTPARALFPILVFAGLLQGRFSSFWCLQNFCKDAFLYFGVCRTLPLHTSQISGDPRAHWYRGVDEIRLFLPIFYR